MRQKGWSHGHHASMTNSVRAFQLRIRSDQVDDSHLHQFVHRVDGFRSVQEVLHGAVVRDTAKSYERVTLAGDVGFLDLSPYHLI
jgi:hypothetical protein